MSWLQLPVLKFGLTCLAGLSLAMAGLTLAAGSAATPTSPASQASPSPSTHFELEPMIGKWLYFLDDRSKPQGALEFQAMLGSAQVVIRWQDFDSAPGEPPTIYYLLNKITTAFEWVSWLNIENLGSGKAKSLQLEILKSWSAQLFNQSLSNEEVRKNFRRLPKNCPAPVNAFFILHDLQSTALDGYCLMRGE